MGLQGPPSAVGSSSRVEDQELPERSRPTYNPSTGADTNIVIITGAVLVVLLCALGMSWLVKCLVRCLNGRVVILCGCWPRRSPLHAPAAASSSPAAGMKKHVVTKLPTVVHRCPPRAASSHEAAAAAADGCSPPPATCAICLSDFRDGDRLRVLPACAHRFHVPCIDTWLAKRSSCPTCRGDLVQALALAHREKPSSHVQLQIVITASSTVSPPAARAPLAGAPLAAAPTIAPAMEELEGPPSHDKLVSPSR